MLIADTSVAVVAALIVVVLAVALAYALFALEVARWIGARREAYPLVGRDDNEEL